MSLTKTEFDTLADGGTVDFGLPADPGPGSQDGIFFTNMFFDTPGGGTSGTTQQGVTSLTTTRDIGEFFDNAQFIVRNSTVNVGDDLQFTNSQNGLMSISGPNTLLTMADTSDSGGYQIMIEAGGGESVSGVIYISDGADVVFADQNPDKSRGLQIGTGNNPSLEDDGVDPGGQAADGTLIIEGAGTTLTLLTSEDDRGNMNIGRVDGPEEEGVVDPVTGRTADGLVIVRDGAVVNMMRFIGIGREDDVEGAQATGALIVEGADTRFTLGQEGVSGSAGFMQIGEQGGTGYFVVRDGADFTIKKSLDEDASIHFSGGSDRNGGEGHGVVTGAGTRLIVEEGKVSVGRNTGEASFEVSDGAEFIAEDLRIAEGGVAEGLITGAGTAVRLAGNNSGRLEIAVLDDDGEGRATSAEGTLTISDGAFVEVERDIAIGNARGIDGGTATGTLIVEGSGTEVFVGSDDGTGEDGFMRVASEGGTGTFILRDGAVFRLFDGADGRGGFQVSGSSDRSGGTGSVVITGEDTELLVEHGGLDVGRNSGTADFELSEGALLEARGLIIGQAGVATGVIEGEDTRLVLMDDEGVGYLHVGFLNDGVVGPASVDATLTIGDEAEVEVRGFIGVGNTEGIEGADVTARLTIEGEGTRVEVGAQTRDGSNGFVRVGDQGADAEFTLRDGAELILYAGDEFGGGLQLSGASDRSNDGGVVTATITGQDTRLVAEQDAVVVGRNGGEASMTISDGAVVDALFFNAGQEGDGHVIIEGEGTELNLSGRRVEAADFAAFMTVGRDAEGSVTIRDGADVTITADAGTTFPGFQAGRNDGGTGVITITGAGTTVTVNGNGDGGGGEAGFIRAGRSDGSDGTINILDGANVSNDPEGTLIVGEQEGSTGRLTVDGEGSIFNFGAEAFFSEDAPGARANAIVTVGNGGLLRGGTITNNGILDIADRGTVNANLVLDNILKSSGGVQDTVLQGNLDVRTAGLGIDTSGAGPTLAFDTYTVVGDITLEGRLTLIVDSAIELSGLELELLTGTSLTASDGFEVRLLELDPELVTQVDQSELFAIATTVGFTTTSTGLTVDFSGGTQTGSEDAETFQGSALDEDIDAGAGNDTVDAGNGNDTIDAGDGDDEVDAGRGDDTVEAGEGDDDIRAGTGEDSVDGGAGDDFIRGGRGEDTITGGTGSDSVVGQRNADTIDGGEGNDNLKGGGGNDSIDGGEGNDFIKGGTRQDVMNGGDGNDRIAGNSFEDVLNGGGGNDRLNAGGDNDTLNGGTGDDTLKGGSGSDTFIFEANMGMDRLQDFDDGVDVLQISSVLTGGLTDGAAVVAAFENGNRLDFGNGNVIIFDGVGDLSVLADDMTIV